MDLPWSLLRLEKSMAGKVPAFHHELEPERTRKTFSMNQGTLSLPHAEGPEKSILSSMIQEPHRFIGEAMEKGIGVGHFYFPANQVLAEILIGKYLNNDPIELVSFTQELLETHRLDQVGGPGYIAELYTYSPTPTHFSYHCEIVKDKHTLRSLLTLCTVTEGAVLEGPTDLEGLLGSTEASVMAIREGRENLTVESLQESIKWVLDDFRERIDGRTGVQGETTGFEDLDRMTGGLKPGNVFVVAARPSMGKTAFMMNVVEHVAVDKGRPAMVFSCEMTQRELLQRKVHSRAKYDVQNISRGIQPVKADYLRIRRAAMEIAGSGLIIDETPQIPIGQLCAKARRMKRQKNICLIAIDYIQLVRSHSKQAAGSREREVSEISASIKALAKELEIPIIVLAQLNRGPEGRTSGNKSIGVPRMSDLRESGSIEQDADMIGLLYRKAYYAQTDDEKEKAAGQSELILAKNRNGPTGNVPLNFIPELSRFEQGRFYESEEPKPQLEPRDWTR